MNIKADLKRLIMLSGTAGYGKYSAEIFLWMSYSHTLKKKRLSLENSLRSIFCINNLKYDCLIV